MAAIESLQMAQVLADLSSLNAAEKKKAAEALVKANEAAADKAQQGTADANGNRNSNANEASTSSQSASAVPRPTGLSRSVSSDSRRAASPAAGAAAHFDMMRLLSGPSIPLSRSSSASNSMPGTPRNQDGEDDANHANTLKALYEIRTKLGQQNEVSLAQARRKMAALSETQRLRVMAENSMAARAKSQDRTKRE